MFTTSPVSASTMATACWRACKSHPIILISASFGPSTVRVITEQFTRAVARPASLWHQPEGDLILRNISIFDSLSGKVLTKQRITVTGERIASVEEEQGQPVPAKAQVLDGSGKMALPGFWDMHQ